MSDTTIPKDARAIVKRIRTPVFWTLKASNFLISDKDATRLIESYVTKRIHGYELEADRLTDLVLEHVERERIVREEYEAIKAAYRKEWAAKKNTMHPNQYHGHAHSVDGIWDCDNGALAGCECAACILHRAAIMDAAKGEGNE